MPKRITIRFVGSAADKQDVRLSDFIDQLESIKRALRENEKTLGEEEPALDYKIVELRHNSPSEMVIEPVPLRPVPPDYETRVVTSFAGELRDIRKKGKTLNAPELMRLQAYQGIGVQKSSHLTKLEIKVGRTNVEIDDVFKGRLDKIVGPDEVVGGSIAGFLEAINFHNTNRFTLYPTLGPAKVAGRFQSQLRDQVKGAIGSFVTVYGRLAYKGWSPFPHAIEADRLEVHKPESELPSLFDLKGTMPDLTGKESSVQFIERIRDESW